MNKKIMVIELLEMFFKKEKMPKRIKVGAFEFEYREELNAYFNINEKSSCEDLLENWFKDARQLNQEVEILEDNTEEIEEIDGLNAYKLMESPYMAKLLKEQRYDEFMEYLKQSEVEIANAIIKTEDKINELVRAVNKLRKEKE